MNQSEKEKNEKIAAMQKLIDIIAETLGSLSYVASKLAKEKMYNSQAVYKFANEVRTSYEKYLITIDDYAENELNDEIRYLEMTREDTEPHQMERVSTESFNFGIK